MTVYARSDLAHVYISEAHGGCQAPGGHSRPVRNGAPVQPWALTCDQCENHLRSDPLWSVTPSEIPETWDESKSREDFERRGAKDKDAVLTLALARLAGIPSAELPESLTRMISGVPAHIPGVLECPSGHGNPAGQKFCGQCGSPMSGPVPQASLPGPRPPAAHPSSVKAGGKPRRLQDGRLDELQALARARGLSDEGTRKILFGRLRAAGATDRDLRELAQPVAA